MIAFISEYYDIPEDEIDLAEMCANAEIVRTEAAEGKYIQAGIEALADYIRCTGADIELNGSVNRFGCQHQYAAASCEGKHSKVVNCSVWCTRFAVCMYFYATAEVLVDEESHDWSVGRCVQTCTRCGKIEMFHEDGGCWFCS